MGSTSQKLLLSQKRTFRHSSRPRGRFKAELSHRVQPLYWICLEPENLYLKLCSEAPLSSIQEHDVYGLQVYLSSVPGKGPCIVSCLESHSRPTVAGARPGRQLFSIMKRMRRFIENIRDTFVSLFVPRRWQVILEADREIIHRAGKASENLPRSGERSHCVRPKCLQNDRRNVRKST